MMAKWFNRGFPKGVRASGSNRWLSLLGAFAFAVMALAAFAADSDDLEAVTPDAKFVAALEVDGAIGPAIFDYLSRMMEEATEQNASLIVIKLDTPGGLVSTTREIVRSVLDAPIPVAVYVYPQGARAASAGTYLMYAAHVAAMAPATHIGAATPVQMGGGGSSPLDPSPRDGQEGGKKEGAEGEEESAKPGEDAMGRKITNDAVAYIRSLAELRGRNADWAEESVRTGASLASSKAKEMGVIDLVANSVPELVTAIDGKVVQVRQRDWTIESKGLEIREFEPDWRTRLLMVITNPNVAYLLMMLGIYGIFFELSNPGGVVPGVAGAVLLLLGLFAMQLLPINYAGLALIGLGLILMVSEAFVPSFGALGIGGLISFVIGSIILIDTDVPAFEIYKPLIVVLAAATGVGVLLITTMALQAWKRPVVSGVESMVGETARALDDFEGEGRVSLRGESWKARALSPIRKGDRVRVVRMQNLSLDVEPEDESKS